MFSNLDRQESRPNCVRRKVGAAEITMTEIVVSAAAFWEYNNN